jgi:uncharacterized phiE125 gp8 family phage protein
MPLVITSAPTDELLTVEEAKRHLRILSPDLDDEVSSLIRAARDYCERFTQRTFRAAVTRTLKLECWWGTELLLPWPPFLAVSSITYYDADNASQTLSSANYATELSTDGAGRLSWVWNATIPTHYDRPDAITITYTAGYADVNALPPVALQAMKTKLTELYGTGTESEVGAAMKCTDRLLGLVDWSGYA